MIQYLLSVHSTEGDTDPSPEVMERVYARVNKFNDEVKATGTWTTARNRAIDRIRRESTRDARHAPTPPVPHETLVTRAVRSRR
jgi:hypothetical protein